MFLGIIQISIAQYTDLAMSYEDLGFNSQQSNFSFHAIEDSEGHIGLFV
jgi:hypothetical protein